MSTNGDTAEATGTTAANDRQARRKASVALLLATGSSIRRAAVRSGVASRTISRWLATDDFRLLVQQTRGRLFSTAVSQLVALTAKAGGRLAELLDSEDEGMALKAIALVLSAGPRLLEFDMLEQRLRKLEEDFEELVEGKGQEAAPAPPPYSQCEVGEYNEAEYWPDETKEKKT